MQLIITDSWLAKSRALHLSGVQLVLAGLGMSVGFMLAALGLYHWVFLEGARQGWPVVGSVVRLLIKDEVASQDAVMRDNLEAMARRLGEMQARLVQLESLSERVAGLAGVPPVQRSSAGPVPAPGSGGALLASRALSAPELQLALDRWEHEALSHNQWFSDAETRLFERKVQASRIPTQMPVAGGDVGSRFGWRIDPLNGHSALHSGLDFPADVGTPILAAAGGVVSFAGWHTAYGQLVEIDHGNEVMTRYAHASKLHVKAGDLVKRGQRIADVGNTGRSSGAHLHFEVLISGVAHDPERFLAAGRTPVQPQEARAGPSLPPAAPPLGGARRSGAG